MSTPTRVGELSPHHVRDAVVKVASRVLELPVEAVLADTRSWGAFLEGDLVTEWVMASVDWRRLSFASPDPWEWPIEHPFTIRKDLDLERTIVCELSPEHDSQPDGFSGAELRSFYEGGRRWLEELRTPSVVARLAAKSEGLIDALTTLLFLHQDEAALWSPSQRERYEIAPAYTELVASIEPPSLRDHIGGFFQARVDAPRGAIFEDAAHRAATFAGARALLEANGVELPPVSEEPAPAHVSWCQCPCDGHGPYGTYVLALLTAGSRFATGIDV